MPFEIEDNTIRDMKITQDKIISVSAHSVKSA